LGPRVTRASTVTIDPLAGFPLVQEGDDLVVGIIESAVANGVDLARAQVVVVTAKIVSKSEGCLVDLATIEPSPRAARLAELTEKDPRLVELALRESRDVVRARPGVLLTRHRNGFISAMAGIDRSNVDGEEHHALLLPPDPDASARAIHEGLRDLVGTPIAVVIVDSHGRPFRVGNVGTAIGIAGLTALVDLEGEPDLFGRPLTTASKVPVADLVASAAILVTGEAAQGIPVAVISGLPPEWLAPPTDAASAPSAAHLVREPALDMFATPDRDYS
jgi:coenzyme F420-0:L-glutamate ligase/coenzyme F420-1:gamma-L-glutamate ligase